jgi:hypothetical protein
VDDRARRVEQGNLARFDATRELARDPADSHPTPRDLCDVAIPSRRGGDEHRILRAMTSARSATAYARHSVGGALTQLCRHMCRSARSSGNSSRSDHRKTCEKRSSNRPILGRLSLVNRHVFRLGQNLRPRDRRRLVASSSATAPSPAFSTTHRPVGRPVTPHETRENPTFEPHQQASNATKPRASYSNAHQLAPGESTLRLKFNCKWIRNGPPPVSEMEPRSSPRTVPGVEPLGRPHARARRERAGSPTQPFPSVERNAPAQASRTRARRRDGREAITSSSDGTISRTARCFYVRPPPTLVASIGVPAPAPVAREVEPLRAFAPRVVPAEALNRRAVSPRGSRSSPTESTPRTRAASLPAPRVSRRP